MLTPRHLIRVASVAALLISATACTNSPTSRDWEQMLAADPRLNDNSAPIALGTNNTTSNAPSSPSVTLPADFPSEIPRYPNAQLQQATTSETRWITSDPSNAVQSFYQREFQTNNWDVRRSDENTIAAQQNDLQVTLTIAAPQLDTPGTTQFTIEHTRTATPTNTAEADIPQPDDAEFIGPIPQQSSTPTRSPANPTPAATTVASSFTDIDQAPQELRQYIQDLATLGVLPIQSTSKSDQATTSQFEPNKTITRREYARWLAAVNNQFYTDNPAKQIRAASATTQPAFQDVPPSDADFAVIQGLAEAGIIPSPLSGSSTTVSFRPDAPLTREQMILWKVPIDTRQPLPTASINAVQETWGFQDAAKIEPRALQAVLADFQNSEQSNIRRVFGYTTLFQPKKTVTRAEAAAALWYIGTVSEGVSAQDVLRSSSQQSNATPTPE